MARFRLLLVALAVWLTILFNLERPDFIGFGNLDLDSVVYVVAAGAAVTILMFPDLGKRMEFVFLPSLVLYAVGRSLFSSSTTPDSIYILITEVAVLFITIALARVVSLAATNFEKAIENVLLDPKSSRILSVAEGEEEVNNELFRARRFNRPVGFILIRVTSIEGMRAGPAERFNLEAAFQRRYLQVRIGQMSETTLYRSDIIAWNSDNLVICLPETTREEALRFAKQLHSLLRIRLNVDVPMGVAAFPDDGLIYRDLLDAALLNPCQFDDGGPQPPAAPRGDRQATAGASEAPSPDTALQEEEVVARSVLSFFRRFSEFLPTMTPPKAAQIGGGSRTNDPDFWVNELPYQSASSRIVYRWVKRIIDLTLVFLSLPVTLPLMGVLSLAIWLDSGRPLFFMQERTGLGGRRFEMYKFRTMVPNAEALLKELADQGLARLDEEGNLAEPLKLEDDPRRTRLGRFLRRTSLDELPQIINVLRGDMSIVGPRPTSWGLGSYTLLHTERLSVRPGITGLWQIMARGNTDFDVWLQWDMLYIDKMSFTLDFQVFVRTFAKILARHGAR